MTGTTDRDKVLALIAESQSTPASTTGRAIAKNADLKPGCWHFI
jgi:hypothetical protein